MRNIFLLILQNTWIECWCALCLDWSNLYSCPWLFQYNPKPCDWKMKILKVNASWISSHILGTSVAKDIKLNSPDGVFRTLRNYLRNCFRTKIWLSSNKTEPPLNRACYIHETFKYHGFLLPGEDPWRWKQILLVGLILLSLIEVLTAGAAGLSLVFSLRFKHHLIVSQWLTDVSEFGQDVSRYMNHSGKHTCYSVLIATNAAFSFDIYTLTTLFCNVGHFNPGKNSSSWPQMPSVIKIMHLSILPTTVEVNSSK